MSAKGIVKTAKYKEGTTAAVLIGKTRNEKVCAIRIPTKEGPRRIRHPAVLQPFKGCALPYRLEGTDQKIEILPYVAVMSHFADWTSQAGGMCLLGVEGYEEILNVNQSICYRAELSPIDGMKNDTGVLPDGSLVFTDPDQVQFLHNPLSRKETVLLGKEILARYPNMKRAFWLDKRGKSKQKSSSAASICLHLSRPHKSQHSTNYRPNNPFSDGQARERRNFLTACRNVARIINEGW